MSVEYLIFGLDPHLSIKKPIRCYVGKSKNGFGAVAEFLYPRGEGPSVDEAMSDLVEKIQLKFVALIVSENLTYSEKRLLKEMKRYMRYHGQSVKSWRRDAPTTL